MRHLTIISLLFLSLTASAQISLEHSYSGIGTVQVVNLEDLGYKYMVTNQPQAKIYLYNDNHTSFKTISINVPANHLFGYAHTVTTKLFNLDGDIEVIATFIDTSKSPQVWQTQIIRESGAVLYSFQNCSSVYPVKVNSNWKAVATYTTTPQYSDVYSLPGQQLYIKAPGNDNEGDVSMYPNPMSISATLAYSLPQGEQTGTINVYSTAGVNVRSYQVTNHFSNIIVHRNDLPAGVYFYSLTTASGAGAAERFVIQ